MRQMRGLCAFTLLTLAVSPLAACGPAPTTPTPSPSASALPSDFPFPSATPTAAPSAMPTGIATPTPAPSASATASPMPSASASAMPSTAPSTSASPVPSPSAGPVGPDQVTRDSRQNFFTNYGVNPFVEAATDPFSTFAADVDTASYTLARGYLNTNQLPPQSSVRTEEYLNYFNYHYGQPLTGAFAIHTDLIPSYFGEADTKMLRVGIQGKEVLEKDRQDAVLTFVIDVSGSMNQDNRLELVKRSLRLLVDQLRPTDKIGIVIYGTEARRVLPHTSVSDKNAILSAIDSLRPEGSTNVEKGLTLAYQEASTVLRPGQINRVILCSDGVANVGETGPEAILSKIKQNSEAGITLTTLGFGMGEYNDTLMEQLANQGDGSYAYIDTFEEAQRVLVTQLTSTLQIIAKDVKIQVAFNPELVDQYRLLGYENRDVADDDFRNDTVDAGEVGANHSVTALYEVRFKPEASTGEVAKVYLRYADVADANRVKELNKAVQASDLKAFSNADGSLRLAVSVAEFAEILRGSIFAREGKLSQVVELARTAQNAYPSDTLISEFSTLAQRAAALQQPTTVKSLDAILAESKNDKNLPAWQNFLLKQLGGKAVQ